MKKGWIITLLIGIAFILSGYSAGSEYTKEQAMVKKGYETIKESLLDPDSLIVYNCYGWGAQSEELMMEQYSNKDSTEKLPDNQYIVYYYVGARNRMGGITDEAYIYIFDPETGAVLGTGDKSDYDDLIDGDDSIIMDHEVQGQFMNAMFWDLTGGWGEYQTDYKEFIESEDFGKLDVEKILK